MVASEARLQYRLRVNRDPTAVLLHNSFDEVLGLILHLENEHGVIRALLPDGMWQGRRKVWSWYGVMLDGRDFGNWGYAVVMRSLFHGGLVDYDVCNDEKLGDVIEAIFHLGFNLYRNVGPFFVFALLFNTACLILERIEAIARTLNYWECSRRMAALLL